MKLLHKIFSLFLVLLPSFSLATNDLFVVIHGTWAPEYEWYQPGGDFFDALEKGASQLKDARVVSFRWSGGTRHVHRLQGARQLKKLIQSYPLNTNIHLVGHSHGATVAIIASELLAKDQQNTHKIKSLFAIGAPIDPYNGLPDYSVVEHLINIFSFGDYHQPLFNYYKREFPFHAQCVNLRATINKKQPNHYEIHNETIGYWIPYILTHLECDNAPFSTPRVIKISNSTSPSLELDPLRPVLREYDNQYHDMYSKRLGIFAGTLREFGPDISSFAPQNISIKNIKHVLTCIRRKAISATLITVQYMYDNLLAALQKKKNQPSAEVKNAFGMTD